MPRSLSCFRFLSSRDNRRFLIFSFCSSVFGCAGHEIAGIVSRDELLRELISLSAEAHLVSPCSVLARLGHDAELAVRADPQFRVNLVVRHDLADEDVSQEEVVVHRLLDNLRHRGVLELDERVVLRCAGLFEGQQVSRALCIQKSESRLTCLFRDNRNRVTSPNWEK